MLEKWQRWARTLKQTTHALYLAASHPRTPWHAKLLAVVVVGYALSPIDLIPDPIPILGYLDDLVLLPLGIWLTLRLIPPDVWIECQAQAKNSTVGQPGQSRTAAAVIVVLWLVAIYFAVRAMLSFARGSIQA